MAALLAVLFLRVPIGVALALVGVCGYAAVDGWRKALAMMGSVPFELASAYSLSVVPLFILMGAVASRAGMSRELFDAANAIFSGFRGALANATIGACAAFGAICGSSIATAATFSKVAIPEMRRHGYEDALAAGCVASAGTLGILIPPSVILAIYSLVAEQSLLQALRRGASSRASARRALHARRCGHRPAAARTGRRESRACASRSACAPRKAPGSS